MTSSNSNDSMVILSVINRTVVTHCRQYMEYLFSSTNIHMHTCHL